jgi:hypothetical protein
MKSTWNKLIISLLSLFSLSTPVYAADSLMGNPFSMLQKILLPMLEFMSLKWIPDKSWPYAVKGIYFIVLIVVIMWGLEKAIPSMDKKVRGVIAFAISFISILFMPVNLTTMAGYQYGGIAGALIFLLPTGILTFAIWKGIDKWNSTPGKQIVKGALCLLIASMITIAMSMLGYLG